MFLKKENESILQRMEEKDPSLTKVRFAVPYNYRISYDATEHLNQFLLYLCADNFISTLKLVDLRLSKAQNIRLAHGILNSSVLRKLVLRKVKRSQGGLWYFANAVRCSDSLNEIILNSCRFSPANFNTIFDVLL